MILWAHEARDLQRAQFLRRISGHAFRGRVHLEEAAVLGDDGDRVGCAFDVRAKARLARGECFLGGFAVRDVVEVRQGAPVGEASGAKANPDLAPIARLEGFLSHGRHAHALELAEHGHRRALVGGHDVFESQRPHLLGTAADQLERGAIEIHETVVRAHHQHGVGGVLQIGAKLGLALGERARAEDGFRYVDEHPVPGRAAIGFAMRDGAPLDEDQSLRRMADAEYQAPG